MIDTSQLLYRIKSNSITLATIAVLSASALTAMGIAASFYYDYSKKLDARYPFSYAVTSNSDSLHKKVEDVMAKYPKNKIEKSVDIKYLEYEALLPNTTKVSKPYKDTVYIISQSKFEELAKARGLEDRITLKDMNEAVLYDSYYNRSKSLNYKNKIAQLNIKNKNIKLQILDFKGYPLINQPIASITLVVKDEFYNKYYNEENVYRVKAYVNKNQIYSKELTNELLKFSSNFKKTENEKHNIIFISAYYDGYRSGLMTNGLNIFIISFLGLVFLAATGSIIFFKQISEANEDRERYRILKNIGVTKKEIKTSIAKQIFFVFAAPLVVGIIHSLVAISLLSKLLNLNIMFPIGISVVTYTLIYMIYYVLTVSSYNKIVN